MGYAAGDVLVLKNMYNSLCRNLNDEKKRACIEWSAIEVKRTWCRAEEWRSSGGRVTPEFAQYFEADPHEFNYNSD